MGQHSLNRRRKMNGHIAGGFSADVVERYEKKGFPEHSRLNEITLAIQEGGGDAKYYLAQFLEFGFEVKTSQKEDESLNKFTL